MPSAAADEECQNKAQTRNMSTGHHYVRCSDSQQVPSYLRIYLDFVAVTISKNINNIYFVIDMVTNI